MGLHTGEGTLGGDDYLGIDVNRAARIAAAGHGGQVLVSEATLALVADGLPEGVSVRDLGSHGLKDLERPVHLHDLVIQGLASDFPHAAIHRGSANEPPPAANIIRGEIP
jgi:class 3 adenylate cyclase